MPHFFHLIQAFFTKKNTKTAHLEHDTERQPHFTEYGYDLEDHATIVERAMKVGRWMLFFVVLASPAIRYF